MNYQGFIKQLELITETIGRVTTVFTFLIMLLTFSVVIMRYGFQTGTLSLFDITISSIAMQESVMYLHSMLFMLASAYTLKHDGHVRVDVFYRRFSPRAKAWVDLFGSLFLLMPVAIFIVWSSWDFVEFAWKIKEKSQEAEGLPWVWLLKAMIPAMGGLLIFQGLLEALKNMLFLAGKHPAPSENHAAEGL